MEAFEKAVRDSELIPSTEEEHWIPRINIGDENPDLDLLLPRLHYLTSIKIAITYITNEYPIPILKRLVNKPP